MEKFVFLAIVAVAAWYWLKPKKRRPPLRLDQSEARAVLGVAPDADAEAIRAAHRRLIAAVHPDRGGSAELTRRINLARDSLLSKSD
ncbi:MAG: J domain-containing protein [Sphingomonas sp.]